MSQQQPRRPSAELEEPIKYGDVFPVQGDLAGEPVRPGDANIMQQAENIITGRTQKGGAASVMQSASGHNERAGLVGHDDITRDTADRGVSVTEIQTEGRRIVCEGVAGQTVSQFSVPEPVPVTSPLGASMATEMVTVGEALEGAGIVQGDKPVELSDAAAIQAAEVRATGKKMAAPGGLAAAAQSAADINLTIAREEDKITIGDVLANATGRLAADKEVTREDAYGVVGAEMRNRPDLKAAPGGVAESVSLAAQLNESIAKYASK
ncbi:hypothetical protein KSP39_PZI019670 [Platanthera zijinensis]|uniref:SMP domain-containing protein n=1 Tax=Platanthera zijinensis TaxID=2320716 RepID=A0AAP0FXW6_9ASPA